MADACGGVFGLWGRVEDDEKAALKRIVDSFNQQKPGAADGLLKSFSPRATRLPAGQALTYPLRPT